jgi:glyoxylase-like metal-dependent hydrolase (beta-lactamase superfamily II)
MRRWIVRVVLAIVVVAALAGIYAYQRVSDITAEKITDDVHVLFGLGGNVGVLRTDRGSVIVDTMTFRMQGEEIRELAEQLTGREVEVIINTHYHSDHTHGNPAFPSGTRIVATKRTRELLEAFDAASWKGDAAGTLPNETFDGSYEIAVGGKTVRAQYLGRGHTSGDLVVLFVEDRVLHTGDLLFNGRYPNIDLEAGGSVREWVTTLDKVLALDGYDQVIPGHGPVTDRDGIRRFQSFLRELADKAASAAAAHQSLADTLRTTTLTQDAGFEPIGVPMMFRLDRDFVVRRAWEEATGTVKPRGPAAAAGGQ